MSSSGLITILFTDLVGSTEMTSDIGDVEADQLRRDHFIDLRGAAASAGGVEVKTIGDALMVSFAAAADALSGAVAMQRAVERRNRRSAGPSLSMRVGISAGDATFEEGDWFGTPVIEASRLCAVADGGQILISDLVRALAGSRSDADITSLGERELKGLPEPVAVCEVRWKSVVDSEALPLPGFVDTDPAFVFAGRQADRDALMSAWKEAAEGSRRVVLVSGEPGVGKTRLVTEVVRSVAELGAVPLWGRCDEELDVPYQPFIEALRHYSHNVEPDRLVDELGPLGGELTRLIPELSDLVPGLAEPLSTEVDTERHRLFEAVADLIEAITATSPVVLVVDDMHWADKPSLLMLRHLMRRPSSMRLLIVATYRDTDLDRSHPLSGVLADLRREPGVERLDLAGLDAGEVAAFMEAAAGHDLDRAALDLAEAVHRETEGNPFFMGEMMRHLAESGMLVQREGRWVGDRSLGDLGIPEGIREVVGHRLSRLSDDANAALGVGAVIGPEFDFSILEATSDLSSEAILDALDEATAAAVIRDVPQAFGRYAFAHALVRSTVYEELGTNRRVRLHWRVGEAIAARHQHDIDNHLDELAHHYTEGALAGDPAKAVEFGMRAARRAIEDLAFEAAAVHFERALGVLELVEAPNLEDRFELELGLTAARYASSDIGFREAGFAASRTAMEMADGDRLVAVALTMTGPLASRPTKIDDEMIELLQSALAALGEARTSRRSQLLSALAVESNRDADLAIRRAYVDEALEIARECNDQDALRAALKGSWAALDGSKPIWGTLEAASDEIDSLEGNDPATELLVENWRMAISMIRGDTQTARRQIVRLEEIAESLRQPRFVWGNLIVRSALLTHTGEIDAAETAAIEALQYGQGIGVAEDMVMAALGSLFYPIRRAQGRIEELVPSLEDLVESQPLAPVWRIALAGALSESDRADEAVEHVAFLTENQCERVPNNHEYPITMCGLGRMQRTVPVDSETQRYMYERLLPFAGTFNWSGLTFTDPNDHGLAMLAARLGEFDTSDAHYSAAVDLCERAGAGPSLAATLLDWAVILVERDDDARAIQHAERALGLGEQMGMNGPHGVVPLAADLLANLR